MTQPYQICTKCIMDTTDPDIWFDDNGACSSHDYDEYNYKANHNLKSERMLHLSIYNK